MGLKALLDKLSADNGIEIDPDELAGLGLAGDEVTDLVSDDVLSRPLPGTAAGVLEVELLGKDVAKSEPVEKDGLMWEPIIREGQWAVRPGRNGAKRRVPLKVVPGKSKDQRREIGLQDILDAFNDDAVQHVTVPTSHANSLLENQGFIDKLKIVDGEVKDLKTKAMKKVKVLLGGYRITEPETKAKMERGTFANRSAGLLYDYVDTERGKKWPVALEHVALTNKPWITGMAAFGRKLAGATTLDTVGLSLSDVGLDDDEYALVLSEEASLSESDLDFLAQESDDWSKEGSPNWLRQQVDQILREKRVAKMEAKRKTLGSSTILAYDDSPPYYRCTEAKPGKALISDGYSDDSNFWAAPITVVDGAVELAEFEKWTALKKAYVADERPDPPKDKLPLAEKDVTGEPHKTRLQLAQEARRARVTTSGQTDDNEPREVVKDMAGENELTLSEEARKLIAAAEARAEAAESKATQLSETVDRLIGTVQGNEVDKYISMLKKDPSEGGLGLTEERGFGGVLATISELLSADDGQPALQADSFATDGNKTGEISFTQGVERIFGAFAKVQEGKKSLGEQLSEPAEVKTGEAKAEDESKVGEDGKPVLGEEEDITKLSADEKVAKMSAELPSMAALIGGSIETKTGGES